MSFLRQPIPLRSVSKIWTTSQQRAFLQARHTYYAWPVGDKPKLRAVDIQEQDRIKKVLLYLLRRATGHEHGLHTRPDGSLSLNELLNYPAFRGMNISQLQELVANDPKHKFNLIFDPTRGGEAWWIRAKLWDEVHHILKPVRLSSRVKFAVYRTTLEHWENSIARNGINCQGDDYIRLNQYIPNSDYMTDSNNQGEVFIFIDVTQCIYTGLRFFYQVATSENENTKTPIFTKGDSLGLITPDLFVRVQLVEAKKTHLWGSPEPPFEKRWPLEELDLDEHGRRRTMLPSLPFNIHGFVDLVNCNPPTESLMHPETIKEAERVL